MMRYIYLIILGLFFSVINMEANNSASISLVPCPTNVVPGTGSFQFTPKTVFAVETEEQAAKIHITGVIAFCLVDSSTGSVSYYAKK